MAASILEPLEAIRDAMARSEEALQDCPGCDREGRVAFEGFRLPCPRLTRQCDRGLKLDGEIREYAKKSISACVPKLYMDRLAAPRASDAIRGVRLWDWKGVLYLYGDTGTGKSFGAAWALYDRIIQAVSPHWDKPWSWGEAGAVRAVWASAYRATDSREVRDAACAAPVLVLDDLGEEVSTPATRAALGEIFSRRYGDRLPTLVTSNIDVRRLDDRYTARMVERIMQAGRMVPCYGENLRVIS